MKVGDLVKFIGWQDGWTRPHGIIVSFDSDNDPVVFWFGSDLGGFREPNYRKNLEVLSESR